MFDVFTKSREIVYVWIGFRDNSISDFFGKR